MKKQIFELSHFFVESTEKPNRQRCFLFLITLLISSFSYSQSNSGKLTGTITDASSNQPIGSVSVQAKTTKRGTSSITDGTYILSLPPGTYSILYSYTGYQSKEITGITIKAGQTTFQNIILETGTQKLQNVVITINSKKEAQSSLYSTQKRSAAASDGISQEAIRKTPDNNAGQILKRVVGLNVQDNRFVVVRGLNDQYNQTTLNGVPMTSTETNRNAFAFNLIPAAAIDNITVNKTATPDMPGNFAGGIVQINTRDFPAKDFYSITVQGSFSDETIGKDFYADKRSDFALLGFANKDLQLPKDFPTGTSKTPIFNLNAQERIRYLKMLPNNLVPKNYGPSGLNETIQFGYGKTIKQKNGNQFGIIAAVSQRKVELIEDEITARDPIFSQNLLPDTISALSYYSKNTRYRYAVDLGGVVNFAYSFGHNKITLKNLYSQVLSNLFTYRPVVRYNNDNYFNLDGVNYIGITHLVEQKKIFNSTLSGEHRTGKNSETRLDWNVNVTLNNTNTPDTRNFIFQEKDSARGIYTSDKNLDYQPSLAGLSRVWSLNKDVIYGGAFNITTPFNLKQNKNIFKSGLLFQNRKRSATGTVLPLTGVPDTTLDQMLAPANYSPYGEDVIVRLFAQASTSSNYNATSNLLAAYESLENKFGKQIRIIWGLRFEDYQQTISVYTPLYQRYFQEPLQQVGQFGARTTFNFLPSVNVIYSPVSSINIRGAYSNTVIRPELKDLASFVRYDYESFSLTQGNQYLKSASITNYDLKFEWFPTAGEIVSFSAFYKNLHDPIEYSRGKTSTDGYDDYRIPLNTGDAYVRGIEAEVRKKIDFIKIAPWLSHLTFFGNGTLLKSHVARKEINNTYFSYVGAHDLTGQAKYIVNAGLSLELFKNTFESTISFNKTGDYINELGSSDLLRKLANGDSVGMVPAFRVKSRNLVDVVITQSLWKDKVRIKFNIINLLDERYLLYQDVNANGKFDDAIIIDITKSSKNYRGGTDNTASDIKGQRTYQFAITYTF